MRKMIIFAASLCFVLICGSLAFSCVEDCNKHCGQETDNAYITIHDSCEETAEFYNQMAVLAGNKPPYDQSWISQCVLDTQASYRQDCMNGCDKCKHEKDFLGGCFIESIP